MKLATFFRMLIETGALYFLLCMLILSDYIRFSPQKRTKSNLCTLHKTELLLWDHQMKIKDKNKKIDNTFKDHKLQCILFCFGFRYILKCSKLQQIQ